MAETIPEIEQLIRDVTQQQNSDSYTRDDILSDLNSFLQNQFHMDIGMTPITKMWNFQTLANVDEYAVSEQYRLINDKHVLMSGNVIDMYFDRVLFDQYFPDAYLADESIGTGDASTTNFTGTLSGIPVVKKSMIVNDDVETFKDVEGSGTLTGSLGGTGTIVYSTGVYDLTFNSAPADGQDIVATYADYTAAQPTAVLYYDNTLKFRPVPDGTYDINIQVAERPATLTANSSLPNLLWGDALAYAQRLTS